MFHGAMRHVVGHLGWFSHFGALCDVALAELPGHGQAPELRETSVEAFAAAFDEAIAATFPDRDIVAVGESIGGLVALSLHTAHRVVALDPPFRTANLWPLRAEAARVASLAPEFWFNVFGIGAHPEDRDYWESSIAFNAPP
jgi:pimeloyl-ACP methyl ester carboxylesterase